MLKLLQALKGDNEKSKYTHWGKPALARLDFQKNFVNLHPTLGQKLRKKYQELNQIYILWLKMSALGNL